MGQLTYPRTANVARNIERAQRAEQLIRDLLIDFNLSDLLLIEALIHSVSWHLLPWSLWKRVLSLYYHQLGEKLYEKRLKEQQKYQDAIDEKNRSDQLEFWQSYSDIYNDYLSAAAVLSLTYPVLDTDVRTFIQSSYYDARETAGFISDSYNFKSDDEKDDPSVEDRSDDDSGGNLDDGGSGGQPPIDGEKNVEQEQPKPFGKKLKIRQNARYQPDVYLLDNGDIVVVDPTSDSTVLKPKEFQKLIGVMSDPDQIEALKNAADNGKLIRSNPLKDHVVNKGDGDKPRYNLTEIPKSLLNIPAVTREILCSVNRPPDTYSKNKKKSFPGCELEHVYPHSCFMARASELGERRGKVPIRNDMGNYTELKATTLPVYDDQKEGTEHWFLTQAEAQISYEFEKEGREGTMQEWGEKMTEAWATMLSGELIRDDSSKKTSQFSRAEAEVVAQCVISNTNGEMARLDVDLDVNLRNGIGNIPGTRDLDYKNSTTKESIPD